MTYIKKILLLGISIFLSGCIPVFQNPVTPLKDAYVDRCLVGEWRSDPDQSGEEVEEDSMVLTISFKSDKVLNIYGKQSDEEGEIIEEAYEGHLSRIQSGTFINLEPLNLFESSNEDADLSMKYVIIGYDITGDNLKLFHLNTSKVEEAIEQGRLSGEITTNKFGMSWVNVTASFDEVAAYFNRQKSDTFEEVMVLNRLTKSSCN